MRPRRSYVTSDALRIHVTNLHKSYRDADRSLTVIECLSMEFPAGRSIGILGASGVGKSTLLHLLGGLDLPSSGTVCFDDLDLTRLGGDSLSDFRARNVGFIFQFHHLLPEFDALENVAMPLYIAGWQEAKAAERAAVLLRKVGLEERLHHRPSELSGGEQQRVAVARAVAARPRVILADEPTGNLDVDNAREVQGLLHELNHETGGTLLVATHSHELARSMDVVFEMLPGGALRPWGEER